MSSTGFFDVPTELQDEILSYLPSGDPPTLQGLQLGLTCKALYEILQPIIVKIQVGRLLEAVRASRLQIRRLHPSPQSPNSQDAPLSRLSEDYNSSWRSEPGERSRTQSGATICQIFYPSGSEELAIPPAMFSNEAACLEFLSNHPNSHNAIQRGISRRFDESWYESECDFGIRYSVNFRSGGASAIEEIWCLHSLISRSERLRRIVLGLYCPKDVGREWSRAFLELLKICAEQPGIEISIVDPTSFNAHHARPSKPFTRIFEETVRKPSTKLSLTSSSLQHQKQYSNSSTDMHATQPALLQLADLVVSPKDFVTSQLSSLSLSGQGGGMFDIVHYPSLHHLAIQSSTLARLHLTFGPDFADDWRAMLSSWKFPQLSHFTIRESKIPLDALISFLRCHPTLTNVSLWVHYHIRDDSAIPPLKEINEDFLPNVCQMVATPSLLVHILSSSASSSRLTPGVELLSSVERLTISQEHDFLRGSDIALKFQDVSTALSLVGARPKNLMPKLHTLSIRTVYRAQQAFQTWIRAAMKQRLLVAPADDGSPASTSSSSPTQSNSPLRGISEFHISAYQSMDYDEEISNCMVHTMSTDPKLVVKFIAYLCRGVNGAAGGLKRVVLSDIFTGCSRISKNWREVDTISSAIEQLWGKCVDLEEVKCLGFGTYNLKVEKVWKRPSSEPPQ